MNKKHIEIRDLLAWTYQHEIPKLDRIDEEGRGRYRIASSSPWDALERLALLGCRVDTSGPGRDYSELVFPDADAMIVDKAVEALAEWTIEVDPQWDGLRDCQGLTPIEYAEAHRDGLAIAVPKGDRIAALVRRLAVTGQTPSWRDHGPIYRRTIKGANGKPLWFRMINAAAGPGLPAVPCEVDGRNPKTRRPYPGAYHKQYLDPSPAILLAERIEYQAWALALHSLASTLERRLSRFFVVPCTVPVWPWEGEEMRQPGRVLLSLAPKGDCAQAEEGA
ncbi:hypothetical protein [Aureimonas sp. SK2]|uniref:hypothetical protein n=1 Tax=Aureimonas sp. SK2 TaxID=3015992 RepID=UPI0024451090|nr:hypothetical protein [Aureimonas sp. SK2]